MFSHVDLSAVALGALAGMTAGAVWYAALGRLWQRAHGTGQDRRLRPGPVALVLWTLGNGLAAVLLADLMIGLGADSGGSGVIIATMLWAGFCLTYLSMSNAFAGRPAAVTLIDAGHGLVSLGAIGYVVGAMS